ncbi:hypothetical protein COU61_00340 [Candidatus Pacearchaeota archaeon CG10_big_fil_rev_8_21_14_0_10_35_13]|nr:MAG: hypothetical protein COU61_00340 [Candidatus Pacearchaeota archaeon CG10_big_fil_rev_8_21_14_0_10_35_13]
MGGFSDMITDTDPEYQRNKKIKNKGQHKLSRALDEEENTEYTADMVNRFITQSNKILTTHPINRRRVERGLLPANIILTRGASVETPKLKQLPTWGAVAYMPVEKGIAQVAGMKTYSFSYPTLKKQNEEGVYENLYSGLIKACRYSLRMIKKKIKKHKYLYVHLKETDTPGHDGKAIEKKKMIEIIDKELIGKIKGIIEKEKIKMIITGDHTTSSTQKEHTPQPVPLMLLDWKHKGEGKRLTEINAKKGKLKSIKTYEVMKKCGFDE